MFQWLYRGKAIPDPELDELLKLTATSVCKVKSMMKFHEDPLQDMDRELSGSDLQETTCDKVGR